MKLTDFLIIYLACGAPFGVYYFLQNRMKFIPRKLWLCTFINFVFWFPTAFSILRKHTLLKNLFNFNFNVRADADKVQENRLALIQKESEKILQESSLKISIYEFRETIDRYIGLTLANQNLDKKVSVTDKDFFSISENKNIELAAICLYRRNQKRLSFHHNQARLDFLNLINKLSESVSNKKTIGKLALELVKTLNDDDAAIELEKLFSLTWQTDNHFIVKKLEKDIWNQEIHKPLPTNPISTRLQTMTAATSLRGKD